VVEGGIALLCLLEGEEAVVQVMPAVSPIVRPAVAARRRKPQPMRTRRMPRATTIRFAKPIPRNPSKNC